MNRVYLAIFASCIACGNPPGPPQIDGSKAERFVAYQELLIPLERKWAKAEKPVPVTEELVRLLASTGLTEKEVTALHEIGAVVTLRDTALRKHLDEEVAAQERTVARTAESSRADAQQSLENLERMRANLIGMEAMRQKYGDAIVEAMLAQEAKLKRQRIELASIR